MTRHEQLKVTKEELVVLVAHMIINTIEAQNMSSSDKGASLIVAWRIVGYFIAYLTTFIG